MAINPLLAETLHNRTQGARTGDDRLGTFDFIRFIRCLSADGTCDAGCARHCGHAGQSGVA